MNPEEIQRVKDLLPTTLGNEEIRGSIAADVADILAARRAAAATTNEVDVIVRP